MQEGAESQLYSINDQERQIQSSLIYRTVRTSEDYHYFNLNNELKLESFKK
jgi:hypothetical protein